MLPPSVQDKIVSLDDKKKFLQTVISRDLIYHAALREGFRVLSADKPFVQSGRKYPSGTLIFKVKDNPTGLAEALAKLAASSGAEVVGTETGWVDEGIDFGSNQVVSMRKPAVALAWDRPTASSSAGWARFVLERQFGYPVTVIRTQQLATSELGRIDVIVLPDGSGESYATVFGPAGLKRLKDWVTAGGTLIGIDGAVSFLAHPQAGLLAIALYSGQLHDPDLIWGHMTMDLLFPGAIGLMMAGVLSAKMSSLAGSSVSYSALFIRNLYQPFVKPKSDRHLINVGRVAIGVTLLGGVGVALFIGNLLDMFKYFISLPAVLKKQIVSGMMRSV